MMNEAKWLSWTHPDVMVEHLIGANFRHRFGRGRDRKLLLLSCACCRRIWHLLADERTRKAVELCERQCDQPIDNVLLKTAIDEVTAVHSSAQTRWEKAACRAAEATVEAATNVTSWACSALRAARFACRHRATADGSDPRQVELRARQDQYHIIRDLFGNPFRPVTLDSSWLTWRDGAVLKMAQAIYEERTFDDLPILADALADAGCSEPNILHHCREGGEHVPGCWVLDLLLGKE
jgi:hypothetical protein